MIYFRLRAPVKGPNARQNFFRMGSRFRFRSDWFKIAFKFKVLAMFHKSCEQSVSSAGSQKASQLFSGRTEFQHTVARPARRTVSFERRPSQRYLCGICYLCCIWFLVFVFVSDYKTMLLLGEHLARGGIDMKDIDNGNDTRIT